MAEKTTLFSHVQLPISLSHRNIPQDERTSSCLLRLIKLPHIPRLSLFFLFINQPTIYLLALFATPSPILSLPFCVLLPTFSYIFHESKFQQEPYRDNFQTKRRLLLPFIGALLRFPSFQFICKKQTKSGQTIKMLKKGLQSIRFDESKMVQWLFGFSYNKGREQFVSFKIQKCGIHFEACYNNQTPIFNIFQPSFSIATQIQKQTREIPSLSSHFPSLPLKIFLNFWLEYNKRIEWRWSTAISNTALLMLGIRFTDISSRPHIKFNVSKWSYLSPSLASYLTRNLFKKMKDFPYLGLLKYHENHTDMLILHDVLAIIVSKYLALSKRQQKSHEDVILHENLCVPLYQVSKALVYKPGITTGFSYNWAPINNKYLEDPVNFSLDDFRMKWLLTGDQLNQRYFFGASVVASFNLARVIKACYEMQDLIEKNPQNIAEIKKRLELSTVAIDKIVRPTTSMYKNLDPKYFYYVLRPATVGYNNLLFNGVKDSEGKEVRLKTPGGAGVHSGQSLPVITSPHKIHWLRSEMFPQHRATISGWRELQKQNRPNIRDYCKRNPTLKSNYNDVMRKYMQFLNLHSNIISKFIMSHVPEHCRASIKGTGDTHIIRIMKRYEAVKDQFLE